MVARGFERKRDSRWVRVFFWGVGREGDWVSICVDIENVLKLDGSDGVQFCKYTRNTKLLCIFFLGGPHWDLKVPDQGSNLCPLQWRHGALNSGLPESPKLHTLNKQSDDT